MRRSVFASVIAVTLMAFNALGSVTPTSESFQFEDKPVREVLRSLAKQFATNIAVQPNVAGNVTGQFVNCSLEEILRDLLPQVKASYCISETTVVVGEPGQLRCPTIPAFRMPFVGTPSLPKALEAPAVVGSEPMSAQPNKLPYFGERSPGMPMTHFMDPRIPVASEVDQPR